VNRLDRVVSQFLGYARPDRGEREALSINDVVVKAIPLLEPQANSVEIKTDFAPELPPVRAAPEQLRQVFLNLGINAIQAMDGKGTLRIVTRIRRGSRRGDVATVVGIAFQDTGKGIPEEQLSDIFIPFFTTKEGGTGLGLPICQRIIENHRGSIEVRSHPGKGPVFTVLLPIAETVASTGVQAPSCSDIQRCQQRSRRDHRTSARPHLQLRKVPRPAWLRSDRRLAAGLRLPHAKCDLQLYRSSTT